MFVTRFISGLREDIRSAISLHWPRDVDTVSALTLIQEQEVEISRAKTSGRDFTRGAPKAKQDSSKVANTEQKPEGDDKLASLKSFRRRNGLCFECSEKWSPAHNCPAHISLHVLEEILDALDIVDPQDDEDSEEEVSEST